MADEKARSAAASEKSLIGFKIKEQKKTMKSNGDDEVAPARDVHKEGNSSIPSSPNGKDIAIDSKQVSSITTTERASMEIDQRCSSSVHDNQDDQLKSAKAEMGEVREENEKLKLMLSKIMKDYHSLQTHFDKIVQQDVSNKSVDPTESKKVVEEEPELISLSLGRFSSEELKKKDIEYLNNGEDDVNIGKFDHDHQGLALGLDSRFYQSSMKNSNNGSPRSSLNESNEEGTTSKSVKTGRSGEDEILQQTPLKKARVSVRATCNTATVQRCAEDMSILITTYEGTHNHPLPVSATAMASTTSAAASMLKSASSTSQPGLGNTPTSTTSANLHGLNFTHPASTPLCHPFYFPNTSISTTQSHPTVTLDLTAPATSSHFNRSSSSSLFSSQKYLPTCLDFSSSSSNNRNNISSSYFNTQQIQEQSYQPYTIEAATKEITSNPKFRSALAAAITSFVGNARENNNGAGESSAFLGHSSAIHNGIGCATSYLNRLPAVSNSQQGNLTLFPSLLPLSASKIPSISPVDEEPSVIVVLASKIQRLYGDQLPSLWPSHSKRQTPASTFKLSFFTTNAPLLLFLFLFCLTSEN
ncbi:hypothetical protein LguiA_000346 [Lonicera macranthoides]